jgi:hypothetical protein
MVPLVFTGLRINGMLVCESRRYFNQGFIYEDWYWIEVTGIRSQPKPLGFKWNTSSAAERIVNRRGVLMKKLIDLRRCRTAFKKTTNRGAAYRVAYCPFLRVIDFP